MEMRMMARMTARRMTARRMTARKTAMKTAKVVKKAHIHQFLLNQHPPVNPTANIFSLAVMAMISKHKLKFALMSIIMVFKEPSNILEISKLIFAIMKRLIWMKPM
jgi:predicted CoA-binding protein